MSAARQLGYARRLQELQADAQEAAQENVPAPPPSGGKSGLEQARQRYASFVTTRAPEWEQQRREAEAGTIARLRGELLDVQALRWLYLLDETCYRYTYTATLTQALAMALLTRRNVLSLHLLRLHLRWHLPWL